DHASDFSGTARYKVLRRLGAGSFGVVYEAEDGLLGGTVALKVLHQPSGNALYRFKNQFRALADLKQENLRALHQLARDKERWFFTMELVRGHDIVRAIWGDAETAMREAGEDSSVQKRLGGKLPFDLDLLRDGFAQLVRGVLALHEAGKIHRDIKPSNILVDEN